MTPVAVQVKTMESYEGSLASIYQQTSYPPVSFVKTTNHTRFANLVTIWAVHLPERAGLYRIGPDCADHAYLQWLAVLGLTAA